MWCFCHAISPLISTADSTKVREAGQRSSHVIEKCYKPPETTETPLESFLGPSMAELYTVHGKGSVKVYLLRGGTWAFPPKPGCRSNNWTFCFMGFPHPQQKKIAPFTSINGHQNWHIPVSSLLLWVVSSSSPLSTFTLSFSFCLSPMYFLKQCFYTSVLLYNK